MKIIEVTQLLINLYQKGFLYLDEDGDIRGKDELENTEEATLLDKWEESKGYSEDRFTAAVELFKEYYYDLPLNKALDEKE